MNVKNLVLGIGIIVVFALVLWQGIEAFYPSPDYQDYCNVTKQYPSYTDRGMCEANGGVWNQYEQPIPAKTNETGYCDYFYKCGQDFNEAQLAHSKIVFYISLIIAIIAVIVGFTVLSVEPVGSALIGAGIWAIFYGTVVNWRNFSNIWRFLLLLVALVALIWIALRLNRNQRRRK